MIGIRRFFFHVLQIFFFIIDNPHIIQIQTLIPSTPLSNPLQTLEGCPRQISERPSEALLHTQLSSPSPEKTLLAPISRRLHCGNLPLGFQQGGFQTRPYYLRMDHQDLSVAESIPANAENRRQHGVSPCPCSSEGIFCCPRVEPICICVINSYIRVSRVDEGLAAFEKMKKYIDGKPPVVTYNIILNGLVKSGTIVDAKGFYEGMVRARVLPDVHTLNILLNGLCRVGDIEGALKVLRESCFRADVVSFNTLIRGLWRGRRVEEGIALCSEMIGMKILPSMSTLEILFDGLIGEGKTRDCVGPLNESLDRGAIFDKDPIDYFGLVDALCRAGAGEMGCALEVVNGMWDKGYPPSVVAGTTLLDGLCKDGRVKEALVLMGRMLKCSFLPDGITLNLVLKSLCSGGRVDEAEELRVLAVSGGWECDEVT